MSPLLLDICRDIMCLSLFVKSLVDLFLLFQPMRGLGFLIFSGVIWECVGLCQVTSLTAVFFILPLPRFPASVPLLKLLMDLGQLCRCLLETSSDPRLHTRPAPPPLSTPHFHGLLFILPSTLCHVTYYILFAVWHPSATLGCKFHRAGNFVRITDDSQGPGMVPDIL